MKARKFCANGDGNPVCPPSKVICKECMQKITKKLEQWIRELAEEKAKGRKGL